MSVYVGMLRFSLCAVFIVGIINDFNLILSAEFWFRSSTGQRLSISTHTFSSLAICSIVDLNSFSFSANFVS